MSPVRHYFHSANAPHLFLLKVLLLVGLLHQLCRLFTNSSSPPARLFPWQRTRGPLNRLSQQLPIDMQLVQVLNERQQELLGIHQLMLAAQDQKKPGIRKQNWRRLKAEFLGTDVKAKLNQELTGNLEMPLIVLGTAGTGTRLLWDLLHRSGVHMSHWVNAQRDSLVFIEWIKKHERFGTPFMEDGASSLNGTAGKRTDENTLIQWIRQHGFHKPVPPNIAVPLMKSMENVWNLLGYEATVGSQLIMSGPPAVRWGFKEPQALYVLDIMNRMFLHCHRQLQWRLWQQQSKQLNNEQQQEQEDLESESSDSDAQESDDDDANDETEFQVDGMHSSSEPPPLLLQEGIRFNSHLFTKELDFKNRWTIVHVIRDGRDIAFSGQQQQLYQRYYVQTLAKPFDDIHTLPEHIQRTIYGNETRVYLLQVIQLWQRTNLHIRRFAREHAHSVNYIPIHLERLCNSKTRLETVLFLMRSFRVSSKWSNQTHLDDWLGSMIDEDRCHQRKYAREDPLFVKELERRAQEGLLEFGYLTAASQEGGGQVRAYGGGQETLLRLRENILIDQVSLFLFRRRHSSISAKEDVSPFTSSTSDDRGTVILLWANMDYRRPLLNWLRHLEQLGQQMLESLPTVVLISTKDLCRRLSLNYDFVFIYCTGREEQRLVDNDDVPFHLNDKFKSSPMGKRSIWKRRMYFLELLNRHGFHVLLMDLDAIPVRAPFFDFLKDLNGISGKAEGQADPKNQNATDGPLSNNLARMDIVASRGHFPNDVADHWNGSTFCMGFIYVRSSMETQLLLSGLERSTELWRDDQRAFNHLVLENLKPEWDLVEYPGTESRWVSTNTPVKMMLLSPVEVLRECQSLSEHPEHTWVVHCHSKKSGRYKEDSLRHYNLWILDS